MLMLNEVLLCLLDIVLHIILVLSDRITYNLYTLI